MGQKISSICEQGDLGLWANELSESDQKSYNEQVKKEQEDKDKKDKK